MHLFSQTSVKTQEKILTPNNNIDSSDLEREHNVVCLVVVWLRIDSKYIRIEFHNRH
jgi:hypothetical protein